MNLLEALDQVAKDTSKMAVPAGQAGKMLPGGIVFNPQDHPCWGWERGGVVRLPYPAMLQGEWEVVEREHA